MYTSSITASFCKNSVNVIYYPSGFNCSSNVLICLETFLWSLSYWISLVSSGQRMAVWFIGGQGTPNQHCFWPFTFSHRFWNVCVFVISHILIHFLTHYLCNLLFCQSMHILPHHYLHQILDYLLSKLNHEYVGYYDVGIQLCWRNLVTVHMVSVDYAEYAWKNFCTWWLKYLAHAAGWDDTSLHFSALVILSMSPSV